MSRRKKDPLRPLTDCESAALTQLSRSQAAPAAQVARAVMLLAVARGGDYQTARACGWPDAPATPSRTWSPGSTSRAWRPSHPAMVADILPRTIRRRGSESSARSSDPRPRRSTARRVGRWSPCARPCVRRPTACHGSRPSPSGGSSTRRATAIRIPAPGARPAPRRAGRRGGGDDGRHRRGRGAQKKLIEDAYRLGEAMGVPVWCTDQAGPFQTIPYPGRSWRPVGAPARLPHEYLRDGTAKVLTLFHPADGRVRVQGATSCPNAILHPWLKRELASILAAMPEPKRVAKATNRRSWQHWQDGLTIKPTLLEELPPLRMLLVLDNLAGHKTPAFVFWLFEHGIMPLYTPVGGSWLNMAESIQRIPSERPGSWTAGIRRRWRKSWHGSEAVAEAVERVSDAVRVGREACGPTAAPAGASPPGRRLGGVHSRAHSPGTEARLWLQASQMTH